ncbi:TIR domain-containing protein [Pseudenhygromyxa sp. WMMC2535]|uniref:SEFIR domain-containing protein n=1 Tax=Pseudenhygromyxa sp. WMMC2535 TaxID=2712867 RepID=UPI00155734E3|nr:TIR domain-containing protein [Pseudenhygromyxa sp. WMMC2535]
MSAPETTRVFISYSHDSPAHAKRVLELAQRLRDEGVDAIIDQFDDAPVQGWPRWMLQQMRAAELIVVVASAGYRAKCEGEVPRSKGRGVKWESHLSLQELYDDGGDNHRYVPVYFADDASEADVPRPLAASTIYPLPSGYDDLYRRLTGQKKVVPVPLGKRREMPLLSGPGAAADEHPPSPAAHASEDAPTSAEPTPTPEPTPAAEPATAPTPATDPAPATDPTPATAPTVAPATAPTLSVDAGALTKTSRWKTPAALGLGALVAGTAIAAVYMLTRPEPVFLSEASSGFEACLAMSLVDSREAGSSLGLDSESSLDVSIQDKNRLETVDNDDLRARVISACRAAYISGSKTTVTVEDQDQRPVDGATVKLGGEGGARCETDSDGTCELAIDFGGGTRSLRADYDGRVAKREVDLDTLRGGVTLTLAAATTCEIRFTQDGQRFTNLGEVQVVVGTSRPTVSLAEGVASFECAELIGEAAKVNASTPSLVERSWEIDTLSLDQSLSWVEPDEESGSTDEAAGKTASPSKGPSRCSSRIADDLRGALVQRDVDCRGKLTIQVDAGGKVRGGPLAGLEVDGRSCEVTVSCP